MNRTNFSATWWDLFKRQFALSVNETITHSETKSFVQHRFGGQAGEGEFSAFALGEGLTMFVVNYKPTATYVVKYPAAPSNDFMLLSVFRSEKPFQITYKDDVGKPQMASESSGLYFYNCDGSIVYRAICPANVWLSSCTFLFSKQWLAANMLSVADADAIQRKITNLYSYRPLIALYRVLLDQVQPNLESIPMGVLQLKSVGHATLTTFLANLLAETNGLTPPKGVNQTDLQLIKDIEKQLVADFSPFPLPPSPFPLPPSPPTILSLAKKNGLSETKLKTLFHRVYGKPLFAYYQSARMAYAHQLLLSQQLTVSQVGRHLGYKNLSNFSLAFKIEFGYLPSTLKDKNT